VSALESRDAERDRLAAVEARVPGDAPHFAAVRRAAARGQAIEIVVDASSVAGDEGTARGLGPVVVEHDDRTLTVGLAAGTGRLVGGFVIGYACSQ
jgi:hypothetical protein